jgi:hypothetical protein
MDHRATYGAPVPGGGVTVAIGAASVASAALTKCSGTVRLIATVDCWVDFNGTTAAAGTAVFLPAYTPEYFEAKPGSTVTVIQSSVAGSLYITQL